VLLPFAPRGPDLWTIDAAVELIGEIRAVNESLRALALVNRADPIGNDNAEAEAAFAEHAEALQVVPGRQPQGHRPGAPDGAGGSRNATA
jgi:chromosome partitioning protein